MGVFVQCLFLSVLVWLVAKSTGSAKQTSGGTRRGEARTEERGIEGEETGRKERKEEI